ncbi:glycosyltransferase family 2 protein [Myroides marinus]|uniref:glycosyltransferase family 2 protein n=1 Tax=Myroides marinus TaxID=703342 RepID=UPI002578C4D9|nr:glycosyltransferase family A protein [Myroides marinus]MDM1353837.1 glycosyltransferase family 2 protein [Myroides marinus]MDM1372135.1 glycosyltransferase family 2 protein [Myroides marinus]MDM1389796.1 glycosyltransferase family 2 protein [Myroides marinus]MDM1501697.1 glycosyltransferase family 2 protein [Myroides marinus]
MKYLVIMPAYNESAFIVKTLDSLTQQTLLPTRVIIVNDNSTDNTASLVETNYSQLPYITLVNKSSEAIHLPGSKVIQAFNYGLEQIDNLEAYDFIVKLDADLILPINYFETIANTFTADQTVGMTGGFAYIEKDNQWVIESLTDKDHIRGAFKAYRLACFKKIGGLKPAMGWDTVDELLCRFYNWKIVTIDSLKVKHLKPTGAMYNKAARYKQGEAFYRLHYGITITSIAAIKLAMKKKKPFLFIDYIKGYYKAKREKQPYLVSEEQGIFIRKYRWQKIKSKLV